jgi:BTB/POZ domain
LTVSIDEEFSSQTTGEFFIDRNSHGFDKILDYMSVCVLSTEWLNKYDEFCVDDNLNYYKIPPKLKALDYSRIFFVESIKLRIFLQLHDGRLCGML